MKVASYNMEGEKIGKIELPDELFNMEPNDDLLHQVMRVMLSRKRKTLAHAKDRSEVRGGGKKPWRQKGTGRARHGSIRSPLWRGGGATFGPRKEKSFPLSIPRKMRKKAFAVALSSKARDNEVFVLDQLSFEEPKTKQAALFMAKLFSLEKNKKIPSVLVLSAEKDENMKRAFNNLPKVDYRAAKSADLLNILSSRYLVFPKDAIEALKKRVN